MTLEEKSQKYEALLHAMQTGVKLDHEATLEKDGSPKSLRVGVNAAMSDHAALARVLMRKGVITEDEYFDAIIEGMQMEVDRYQRLANQRAGAGGLTITLA